jgi:two-component system, OmpR family, KDP operon response regulator KdpE
MPERVLVCDPDATVVRALRPALRSRGFTVIDASTGEEALDMAALHSPRAVILDLVLPDVDGIEVCRRLREWSDMAIIVLSAIGEEDTKVRALRAGADDYVTKPFGTGELIARLHAALRRVEPDPASPVLRAEGLEVDIAAHTVRRDGEEVHLTKTEFELLRLLIGNRGRLLNHRALLVEVWGPEYAGDVSVLRGQIANLRRKLDCAARHARTSGPSRAAATASSAHVLNEIWMG